MTILLSFLSLFPWINGFLRAIEVPVHRRGGEGTRGRAKKNTPGNKAIKDLRLPLEMFSKTWAKQTICSLKDFFIKHENKKQKALWWVRSISTSRHTAVGLTRSRSFKVTLVLLVLLLAKSKRDTLGSSQYGSFDKYANILIGGEEKSSQELVLVRMWTRYDQYLVYCLNVPFAGHLCPTCWVNSRSLTSPVDHEHRTCIELRVSEREMFWLLVRCDTWLHTLTHDGCSHRRRHRSFYPLWNDI